MPIEPSSDLWDKEEIENFMSDIDSSDFEPGMKQGVRGDVTVEEIAFPPQCEIHESDLMVDTQEKEYYCPMCE